jgi:uncharacterized protein (DUF362 family)/Pyruvate/2-oxoacid:ferredoxin oxidoreductase delta subunit
MSKARVALIRCDEYDPEKVFRAVSAGLDLLGGAGAFAHDGEKILLKPNVLWGSTPEKCVTTHPTVLGAVARLFKSAGAILSYGDSPGFGSLEAHLKKAGLQAVADVLGVVLADFENRVHLVRENSVISKRFLIAKGVAEADGLISLPKLKTHALVRLTGAVKNQFGCIPGTLKSQFHVKVPQPDDFSAMLVELNLLIRPRLFIMDGIMAMEGNGPRNGQPRAVKALLFSTDPVALDAVACRLVNLNPGFVPTCVAGEKAGLGTYRAENIEIVGDPIDSLIVPDFKVVRRSPGPARGMFLRNFIKNNITVRPVVGRSKCTSCGTCLKVCPVGEKALHWIKSGKKKFPRHEYSHCIRCYCCQELCPEGAITAASPILGKLLFRN